MKYTRMYSRLPVALLPIIFVLSGCSQSTVDDREPVDNVVSPVWQESDSGMRYLILKPGNADRRPHDQSGIGLNYRISVRDKDDPMLGEVLDEGNGVIAMNGNTSGWVEGILKIGLNGKIMLDFPADMDPRWPMSEYTGVPTRMILELTYLTKPENEPPRESETSNAAGKK